MKKNNKIVLSSNNQNKIAEFKKILSPYNINLIPVSKYTSLSPKENGRTFRENALIKARFAAEKTNWNYSYLSDDSGLCIKVLNDFPGIYSARIVKENNYNLAFETISDKLKKLKKVPIYIKAEFICSLAFINHLKEEKVYQGKLIGRIKLPAKGDHGFGYDPIFIPKGMKSTLAELKVEEKNTLSHRAMAVKSFINDVFV